MKKLFALVIALFLFSCTSTEEPNLPAPGKVFMVPRSDDMAEIELGIDAVPGSDGIQVQWFDSNDRNVEAYRVYRMNESETFFKLLKTIDLEKASAGSDTTYIDNDPNLKMNSYNYYYVTALNKDAEGVPSDTVRYYLYEKPETTSPSGYINGNPVFYWTFPVILDSFILRIEEDFTERIHFIRKFQSNYDHQWQELDISQIENPPLFESNRSYRWRVDIVGTDSESSGSESKWLTFVIN
jgi:hypothetical protein